MKKITKLRSLAIALAFIAILPAACDLGADVKNIKAEELRKLIAEVPGLLIIDNRSEFEFAYGRLPKSVNIPQEKFTSLAMLLPQAKDTPMVFYCRGYS